MDLVTMATDLLSANPEYAADARKFAAIGNSVVGSVLSLTTGSPRWATERAVCEALRSVRGTYRTYRQMSAAQHGYVAYVAAHPGCSIADVDRACRRNPQAGHKWVYDGVNRLVSHRVLRKEWHFGRAALYVVEG